MQFGWWISRTLLRLPITFNCWLKSLRISTSKWVYHDNVRNRNDLNNTSYLDAVERNSKILSSQDNEHVRRWRVIRENKPKHHIKQYKPGVGNLFHNTDRSDHSWVTKVLPNWKRLPEKILCFWRKVDEILAFVVFLALKCTHYWKWNSHFCTSLKVQTVMESWSLALGQLRDFPQRGIHGEFIKKTWNFWSNWPWFYTDW